MIFIKEFFLFALYLLVFIVFYLSIERFLIWKKITIKYEKQVSDFLMGLSMGVITLLIQIFNEKIMINFSIKLFIVSALMITFFKNFVVGLYSLVIPIIFMVVNKEITYLTYIIIIIFFASMISMVLISNIFQNFTAFFAWYISSTIIALSGFLVGAFVYSGEISFVLFSETLLPYLLSLFAFFALNYSTKVVTSSRNLYESSNFIFGKYYRSSLAFNAIGKMIEKEKITFGSFIIFKIDFDNKTDQVSREIEETILEKIEKSLPIQSVQFDASDGRYGFFIKSSDHNPLKNEVSKIFSSLPTKLRTITNGLVDVRVKAAASFYGKDSGSLNELSNYCNFTINYSDKEFSWFNYYKYKKWISDNYSLNLMDKKLQLDNFANIYHPIIDINNFKQLSTKNTVKNISEFSFVQTIEEIVDITGWKKEFDRYFSLEAIKYANNSKVFVEYSPTIFENNFSIEEFDLNIKKYINISNVGLILREKEFNKIKNIDKVKKTLKEISDLGITLIFENLKWSKGILNWFIIQNVHSKNNVLNPERTILENVNLEKDLLIVKEKKVKYFTGDIINSEISFSKISKKSKIYLESILKRKES